MDEGNAFLLLAEVAEAVLQGVHELDHDSPSSEGLQRETKEEKGKEELILQEENDKENIIDKDNTNNSDNDNEMVAVEAKNLFHEDVLDVITKKLDFDDLYFPFGAVCHDWRESFSKFKQQFMANPAPLMLEMLKPWDGIVAFSSFIDGSFYQPKLPDLSPMMHLYTKLKYLGFSTGNMIMVDRFSAKFFLVNPFARKKIEIDGPVLPSHLGLFPWDHALLAYAVGSEEEFTIVVWSKPNYRLFSYQSRNNSWMYYDQIPFSQLIVDVVVFHRALYSINYYGQIGVVSLNKPRVKYIHQIKNAPWVRGYMLKLVVSEGKLLVVLFKDDKKFEIMVYRIDFSEMEWVKMESLEKCALFLSKNKRCYAVSNPGKFGYLSNHVYYVDGRDECKVFQVNGDYVSSMSHFADQVYVVPPLPETKRPRLVDWCFRTFREEVDYSLDD